MKNQFIKVTNKFTGAVSFKEVHPTQAFAALNHFRSAWNVASASIVTKVA